MKQSPGHKCQLFCAFSTASASLDDHVVIIFEYDLVILVDVQHGDGRELGGDATGPRNGARIDRMNQRLNDGVIGRVEMIGQRERTIAVTIIGVIARRCHDPVVPADVVKVDVK